MAALTPQSLPAMLNCVDEDDIGPEDFQSQGDVKSMRAPSIPGSSSVEGTPALQGWLESYLTKELTIVHEKLDRILEQTNQAHRSPLHERTGRRNRTHHQDFAAKTGMDARHHHHHNHDGLRRASSSGSQLSLKSQMRRGLSGLELVLGSPKSLKHAHTSQTCSLSGRSASRIGTLGSNLASTTHGTLRAPTTSSSVLQVDVPGAVVPATTLSVPEPSGSPPEGPLFHGQVVPQTVKTDTGRTGSKEHMGAEESWHNSLGSEQIRSRVSEVTQQGLERARFLLSYNERRGSCTNMQLAWEFLDTPGSSKAARVFATIMDTFILTTVFITLIQSTGNSPVHGMSAAIVETTIDSLFLAECLVRFACCPNHRVFLFDPYNIIDIFAALPLAIRAAIGFVLPRGEVASAPHAILLCAVPILRLLKTLRRFEKFHLILNAFALAAEALPVMLFILSMIALTFSMIIYLVEPRDNIESIPMSLWMTIVTMSTVGYGDMFPRTSGGHFITGILITISALYMSIPLGIVGNAFAVTWEARDKILLMQRTRDRLRQWGYTASDIPALFHMAAPGHDSELDLRAFRQLLQRMQIGFSEERIQKLFESFDKDGSGTVGDREFVHSLFPGSYMEIYKDDFVTEDGASTDDQSEEPTRLSGSF